MKISTKGRYALRLLLDIAINDTGSPVALKDIAKRQNISDKYLEQIIAVLNKAGYVTSIRGAQGGYRLTKAPDKYIIGDVIRLTEGDFAPVSCVGRNAIECDRKNECVTVILYDKIYEAISGVVDNLTLADLVSWHEGKATDYII